MSILHIHPYYNVPSCPNCGSEVTGRYVREASGYAKQIIKSGLKNGEIIRIAHSYCRDRNFCLECTHEWQEYVPMSFINDEELAVEMEKRHIKELAEVMEDEMVEEKPKKKRFFGLFG